MAQVKQVLDIQDLQVSFGERRLFNQVECRLHTGQIYGLVGHNGSGKSTLLHIIAGDIDINIGGSVNCTPRVALLAQQPGGMGSDTVTDYLLRTYRAHRQHLEDLEAQLAQPGDMDIKLQTYQQALDAFEADGGEDIPQQMEKLLELAGLTDYADHMLSTLSGGERRLLDILEVQLRSPDLLLMDEPEIHLDAQQVMVLVQILKQNNGCVLVISHNRYLLDMCCTRTLVLSGQKLTLYNGNFSFYRAVQLQIYVTQQRHAKQDKAQIKQQQAVVDRIAAIAARTTDPAWGRRLRARKRLVAQMTKRATAPPEWQGRELVLNLANPHLGERPVLTLQNYGRRVEQKTLVCDAQAQVWPGERIALWGPNGCGKSTLIKDILAPSHEGILRSSMKMGYIAQTDDLSQQQISVWDYLQKNGCQTQKQATGLVMSMGFVPGVLQQTLSTLSGGERLLVRLGALSLDVWDMLVLDEPTSHLDVFAQDALQQALDGYEGTIVMVTHDPYWVQMADRIWCFEKQGIVGYDQEGFERKMADTPAFARLYKVYAAQQREREDREDGIEQALAAGDDAMARKLCGDMVKWMQRK